MDDFDAWEKSPEHARVAGIPVPDYIQKAAVARGIDPKVALRVATSEGLREYIGDQGSSFGPFQLHYGNVAKGGNAVGGLGDDFTKATGLHAKDPSTIYHQIDFALDHAVKNGWGAFHGARKVGLDDWAGIKKGVAPKGEVAFAPEGLDFPKEVEKDFPAEMFAEPEVVQEQAPQKLTLPQIEITPKQNFGVLDEALHGATQGIANGPLGKGPVFIQSALENIAAGKPVKDALTEAKRVTDRYVGDYNIARQEYNEQYPTRSAVANVMGGMAPALGAIGAGNALLRGGAALLPRVAPAANVLMGTAGEGMTGVPGFLARRGTDLASGALQGAEASLATGQDPVKGAEYGAGLGLLTNPLIRNVTAPLRAAARPEVARAAQDYISQGGSLPASAIIEGPSKGFVESLAGRGGTEAVENFSQMLGDRVGARPIMEMEGVKGLTPRVLEKVKEEIYQGFDDFASTYGVQLDKELIQDLRDVAMRAKTDLETARPEALKAVIDTVRRIAAVANSAKKSGTKFINGKQFRQLTSKDSVIDDLYKADHNAKPFADDLKEALYSALERTAPEGKEMIQELRKQYRDLLRLEKVAPGTDSGLVNPRQVAKRFGKEKDDFGKLARMGQYLPTVDASGNVKGRAPSLLSNVLHAISPGIGGAALGGGVGALLGEVGLGWIPQAMTYPGEAAAMALGGGAAYGAKSLYGSYLNSPAYLQRVINNSLAPQARPMINPLMLGVPMMSGRD